MCGINGIFAYLDASPAVDEGELTRVRDSMAARGPDGQGLWISDDGRVGFGHRRLAIIDLSPAGAQPMTTPAGNWITFNGEIYNYRDLRKELEAKGHHFRTQSDTEVILHLYADRGVEMLRALRGMFAIALWDEKRKGLLLARDHFGIKPLYYTDDGKALRFASQVKALLAGAVANRGPDPAGHAGFFIWGSVPEPHTLYKSIRSIPAGSTLWVNRGGRCDAREYFSITGEFVAAEQQGAPAPVDGSVDEVIREGLDRSVRRHMTADVPVGVFLSSGLDSAAITAFASTATGERLRTITLGCDEFKGSNEDETPIARLVAERYGCRHTERWYAKSHFKGEVESLMSAMDQPSVDGANTFFVSRAAARAGLKVAMSGLGGDETLGGYPSFGELPRAERLLRPVSRIPGFGVGFRRVVSCLPERWSSPKYAGLFEFGAGIGQVYFLRRALFMPWELSRVMEPDMARAGWDELDALGRLDNVTRGIGSDFLKVSALEMTHYMRNQLLRDSDWAGMASSLEIRVPFLDVDFLRCVARFAASRALSRKAILSRIHGEDLSTRIAARPKTGFLIPLRQWGEDMIAGMAGRHRGLRGWARAVHARFA